MTQKKPLYSLAEEAALVLSVLAEFFHQVLHQIQSHQTEISEIKDRLTDFENIHAENENLRDERSRWLQQPDYDSQDCCSYADSLERESSAQRRGGG